MIYFTDSIELSRQVHYLSRELPTTTIDTIFFYGAGCLNLAMKNQIKEAFYSVFPNIKVEVDNDLMAAARALFGSKRVPCDKFINSFGFEPSSRTNRLSFKSVSVKNSLWRSFC